jgi:hypothetical protein
VAAGVVVESPGVERQVQYLCLHVVLLTHIKLWNR